MEWCLTLLVIIWVIAAIAPITNMYPSFPGVIDWQWPENRRGARAAFFGMDPATNSPSASLEFPFPVQFIFALLLLSVIQGLLVNMGRDEKAWRQAGGRDGATIISTPFYAVLQSWEAITLFILKSILYWLLGQALIPNFDIRPVYRSELTIHMLYAGLLVYGCGTAFTATFAGFLAVRKPKGNQLAAWGHIQKLTDLVDGWGRLKALCSGVTKALKNAACDTRGPHVSIMIIKAAHLTYIPT